MRHVDDCLDNLHCSEGGKEQFQGGLPFHSYGRIAISQRIAIFTARADCHFTERDALGREARSMRERGREGLGRTKNLRVVQFHRLGFTGGDLRGR